MPICARCSACVMAKRKTVCFIVPFFADLVVIARSLYPIPSRTRPSKSSAPMVLNLKVWKSRSLPGLPRTERFIPHHDQTTKAPRETAGLFCLSFSAISAAYAEPNDRPDSVAKSGASGANVGHHRCAVPAPRRVVWRRVGDLGNDGVRGARGRQRYC